MSIVMEHPTLFAIGAYWAFSALIGGMPTPTDKSSSGYQWAYASLHILAGNISSAVASRYPNIPGATTTEKTEKTVTIPPPETKP